jgi:RNA polymerase sigma factor (sigma-70 family)
VVSFENANDLVRGCRHGETAAWDELLDRYGRLIWSVAQRCGLEHGEAEEVFQNTWVAIVNGIGRLHDPSRLASWVASTTRHQAYQLFSGASRRRRGISLEGLDAENQPKVPPEVAEALEEGERRAAITEAVHALPPRCRELITFLFLYDPPLDYLEISCRTGLAVGSIGPIRARCLDRLRKIFEKLYHGNLEDDH